PVSTARASRLSGHPAGPGDLLRHPTQHGGRPAGPAVGVVQFVRGHPQAGEPVLVPGIRQVIGGNSLGAFDQEPNGPPISSVELFADTAKSTVGTRASTRPQPTAKPAVIRRGRELFRFDLRPDMLPSPTDADLRQAARPHPR